ncbi:hypothetical protein D9619_006421 [Psilocybe cf. subviscida]|uniref:F-box domain-containing protein n=1 Tax=Psilocybe cf. subviscida TaxID=2480587 RepID=A0A8H5EXX4_9AGAR|nr:hypothetical protein D9619_006421 [Psilocybe cf. subviscida]
MHPALLIDELLRQIFLFVEDDRKSLLASARTCKAWKDPALDYIWEHLTSFGPLLLLLPGVSSQNGEYVFGNRPPNDELVPFKSYARRVRHVNHRKAMRIQPGIAALSPFAYSWKPALPNIRTAHLNLSANTSMLIPLSLSLSLQHLDIDLGFRVSSAATDIALCNYLEQVTTCCPNLQRLSLRGLVSERLSAAIAGLNHLHGLSLRLGRSLSPKTLSAIIKFPNLSDLEIHAGHVNHDDLDDLDDPHATFNALKHLTLRAKTPLVDKLLGYLQPNTLQCLKIDLDDTDYVSTSWDTVLSQLSSKAERSLSHLTLEHQFELTEVASPTPQSLTPSSPSPSPQALFSINFDALQSLRNMQALRHFSCDLTLPPMITDSDMEKLVTWWPNLECLVFSSARLASDTEREEESFPTQVSSASLALCARKMKKLQKLALPVTIDDTAVLLNVKHETIGIISTDLHTLIVSQVEVSRPQEIACRLRTLFPGIHTLESLQESQACMAVNDAIRAGRAQHFNTD